MKVSKEIREFFHIVSSLFSGMLFGWLLYLMRVIRSWKKYKDTQLEIGGGGRGQSRIRCMPISDKVYRRPDPTIYSQAFLMELGIAVTWDNPDIYLQKDGLPVSSEELDPDTDYEIVARIWNNSINAAAVHLPVKFSYLDFGIGTMRIPIGETTVDLPVKGAPGHPAFAHTIWHSPLIPGHYCIVVELVWSDDANPRNNIGQENTYVRQLNSRDAQFEFPVRNDKKEQRIIRLEVDGYQIPAQHVCQVEFMNSTPEMSKAERDQHLHDTIMRNDRKNFPLPSGWHVHVSDESLVLEGETEKIVTVNVEAPDDFHGKQAININAFDRATLIGGVTLYVRNEL